MSLILKLSACQPNDCNKLNLWDSTGSYNASTNPGGWGAPNADPANSTSAVIKIYPPGYTIPIIFTFTITLGVITKVERTDPNGTVTDITASNYFASTWPFDVNSQLVFTSDILNIGVDQGLQSGNWFFEYFVVDGGTTTYNTSTDDFLFCLAECCVEKMLLKVTPEDCGCSGGAGASYTEAWTKLMAAQLNAKWGLKEAAQSLLDKALELCGSNCKGC